MSVTPTGVEPVNETLRRRGSAIIGVDSADDALEASLLVPPLRAVADELANTFRNFMKQLGATPVSISFPEVYPSLQRGVANCGVTSPTSANTGRWPEVTSHLLPLSVSGSVQAHLVNAAWFAKLSTPQKDTLSLEIRRMEAEPWNLARNTNNSY
jgi:TRAP-type C4-dicarboxylate transport system substrate-binding protein